VFHRIISHTVANNIRRANALAIASLQTLKGTPIVPAFFFCLRTPAELLRSDPTAVLKSLLCQMQPFPSNTDFYARLYARYDKKTTQGDLSFEEVEEMLVEVMNKHFMTVICIDALDECDKASRGSLLDFLCKTQTDVVSPVKVLVTSRDDQDIKEALKHFANVPIVASNNRPDIIRYVDRELENAIQRKKLLRTQGVENTLRQTIRDTLIDGSQGM